MMGVADENLIVGADTQVDPAFWMRAANQAIRTECGWHVAPIITEELVLDGRGGTALLLPSQRVRHINKVLNDGRDVTEQVRFSRRTGVLTLASGWSRELGGITVDFTHGYEAAEVADVAALIVTLTRRAASGPTRASQAVGGASESALRASDGTVLGVPLMASEKALLAPYRLTWGV